MPRDDERATTPARTLRGAPPLLVGLGAAILVASLAGCAWLIVLATRHADVDVAQQSPRVLKVPLERAAAAPAPEGGVAAPR